MIVECVKVVYLIYQLTTNTKQMTTLTNQTGSKAVNIKKNMSSFIAMYVQVYNGYQQVLETKDFNTLVKATKWAESKLS